MPYNTEKSHSSRCKAKCKKCCTLSWNTPCVPDSVIRKCSGCNKSFDNLGCYQRHLDKNICNLYKQCAECGQKYKTTRRKDEYGNVRPAYHFCSTKVLFTDLFFAIHFPLSGVIHATHFMIPKLNVLCKQLSPNTNLIGWSFSILKVVLICQ